VAAPSSSPPAGCTSFSPYSVDDDLPVAWRRDAGGSAGTRGPRAARMRTAETERAAQKEGGDFLLGV
jgi:hypothetical protein